MMIYLIYFISFFLVINIILKTTFWYKALFSDTLKFKGLNKKFKVVNLGSNSGKYAFDYDDSLIEGKNWALGPQTIEYDFKILTSYAENIEEDGYVIFPISLFTSIKDQYKGIILNIRYYYFLPPEVIPNYSKLMKLLSLIIINFPIIIFLIKPLQIINLLRVKRNISDFEYNELSESQLEADALNWFNSWKNEFCIDDFNSELSSYHLAIMEKNKKILESCILFCKSRNLKPVILLAPISQFLNKYLTSEIKRIYIYNFLDEFSNRDGVIFLDFLNYQDFNNSNLFFNSFFLNKKGRRLFTIKIIKSLMRYDKN